MNSWSVQDAKSRFSQLLDTCLNGVSMRRLCPLLILNGLFINHLSFLICFVLLFVDNL